MMVLLGVDKWQTLTTNSRSRLKPQPSVWIVQNELFVFFYMSTFILLGILVKLCICWGKLSKLFSASFYI